MRKSKGLTWHGKGERIGIGPYDLDDPLIYVSRGRPREDEASCVDLKLPICEPRDEGRELFGYSPRYAALTVHQRANYLRWLAGGRRDPLDDIGYAFLFLYGLERRLLVDGVTCKGQQVLQRIDDAWTFEPLRRL